MGNPEDRFCRVKCHLIYRTYETVYIRNLDQFCMSNALIDRGNLRKCHFKVSHKLKRIAVNLLVELTVIHG